MSTLNTVVVRSFGGNADIYREHRLTVEDLFILVIAGASFFWFFEVLPHQVFGNWYGFVHPVHLLLCETEELWILWTGTLYLNYLHKHSIQLTHIIWILHIVFVKILVSIVWLTVRWNDRVAAQYNYTSM